MSPAHLIALYLAAQGAGVFAADTGWSINAGGEPPSPDTAITIYDTGGASPDTDEQDLLRPAFQVRVRAASYPAAYAKQEAIRDLLILPQGDLVQGTARFIGVFATSDILAIGRDETDRYLLTANYQAIKLRNAAEVGA
jgi:hypothetical protein